MMTNFMYAKVPLKAQPYPPIQAHLGALKAIRFCLQKAKEKAHDKQVRTESGAPKSNTQSFTGEEDAVNVFTPVFVCPVYQAALKRNSPLIDQEIWKFAKDWLDDLDQFEIDETADDMENSAGSLQKLSQDSSQEEIAMGRQLLVSLLDAGRDRIHKFRCVWMFSLVLLLNFTSQIPRSKHFQTLPTPSIATITQHSRLCSSSTAHSVRDDFLQDTVHRIQETSNASRIGISHARLIVTSRCVVCTGAD